VSDVDIEQLRRDVGAAIAEAVSRHERSMVSRWVAVVETIEAADGVRGLWCLAPDDLKKWDTLGLLTFALDVERAATVADRIQDDE
jgi:2-keto-3-deoxy-L-rhamnonate aldolase RhmA